MCVLISLFLLTGIFGVHSFLLPFRKIHCFNSVYFIFFCVLLQLEFSYLSCCTKCFRSFPHTQPNIIAVMPMLSFLVFDIGVLVCLKYGCRQITKAEGAIIFLLERRRERKSIFVFTDCLCFLCNIMNDEWQRHCMSTYTHTHMTENIHSKMKIMTPSPPLPPPGKDEGKVAKVCMHIYWIHKTAPNIRLLLV